MLLLDERGKPVFGIVVEVQLARDPDKLLRWPLYAVTLRVRHGCPVAVLGPDAIPRIQTPDVPVELALLSAKAHAETEGGLDVVEAALRCVMQLDASFAASTMTD